MTALILTLKKNCHYLSECSLSFRHVLDLLNACHAKINRTDIKLLFYIFIICKRVTDLCEP